MYRYQVRPGYGSEKLLVEFLHDSSDDGFVAALRSVFSANGVKTKEEKDLIFMVTIIMDSPVGSFAIDHDEWDMIWIHAEENQNAIQFVDHILSRSGQFQKEEVDFNKFAQQPSPGDVATRAAPDK